MASDWNLTGELANLAANTIRMLAADAVEKAKSGHPGMPMGAADYALVLWGRHLRVTPRGPHWMNRDRFILSAGHGSMLLYALLHLCGYDISMEQIQQFRQWESVTPGHPEYDPERQIEATTGPLGQGFGAGVGMAIAAKMLAARFNRPDFPIIDHHIYAICSDGDLMEGISHEAASLAGHLRLDDLVYIYDDNKISIEGSTELTYSDDVASRFRGYHWAVAEIDGHDREAADRAIVEAKQRTDAPSLIIARSHIGFGSPNKQDTGGVHGEPLGEDELRLTKENLGWPVEPRFLVPDEVRALFAQHIEENTRQYEAWNDMFARYRQTHPELAEQWDAMMAKSLPDDLESKLVASLEPEKVATRKASGTVLQVAAELVPWLVGGSADLAPSTNTLLKGEGSVAAGRFDGRNLHFGVREHGMGAVLNGLSLYGGWIPYGATFLIFSDYMRPAIRLAAMMRRQVVYVFTHDSILIGEDGPTHQPIEQLAGLRAVPNLAVIRPADGAETAVAWAAALRRKEGPTALILTRQSLPPVERPPAAEASGLKQGGYVLLGCEGPPEVLLIGTGSEVHLLVEVWKRLGDAGRSARVISMPSLELFLMQPESYREDVLPATCPRRVVVEAANADCWRAIAGTDALIIGIDCFGASAPYAVMAEQFGFTADSICTRVMDYLSDQRSD